MVMDSEFNTTSLNTNIWTPGWFGSGVTDPVNSNEDDCYTSNNVVATGTALDLNITYSNPHAATAKPTPGPHR